MALQLVPLKFQNVEKILGGAVALKIDKELHKAFMDCADSPELAAGRVVTLTMTLKPKLRKNPMGGRSEFSGCDVTFGVGGRTPTQAIEVSMAQSPQGLLFNPDAPENPMQHTIEEDD